MQAYLGLCGASFLIASYFVVHGVWMVMAFAVLEMTAVAAAFVVFGRHATDRECISLSDAGLVVELVEAERTLRYRLDPCLTRVAMPQPSGQLIGLEANGDRVEVGRFLPERRRREFAQELNRELVGYRLDGKTN